MERKTIHSITVPSFPGMIAMCGTKGEGLDKTETAESTGKTK
jgi:hypothetical protein